MPDYLSTADLALLRAALAQLRSAQAVFAFVSQHLATCYGIGPQELVSDENGAIKRKDDALVEMNGAKAWP